MKWSKCRFPSENEFDKNKSYPAYGDPLSKEEVKILTDPARKKECDELVKRRYDLWQKRLHGNKG